MQILALCSYPIEAAATRYRLSQFVEPLGEKGIDLTVSSFLSSAQFKELYGGGGFPRKLAGISVSMLKRFAGVFTSNRFDVVLVQREAMFFGPAVFELLYKRFSRKKKLVLDLDDATYVSYISPTYGRAASFLKFFGKTDKLIKTSEIVICGNQFIAEHVTSLGTKAVVIPTVVDGTIFKPKTNENEVPVIGWIGTHSTYSFVSALFPVLRELAKKHTFNVRLVGTGTKEPAPQGFEVENREWSLDREVEDFRTLDIGLYPIDLEGPAGAEWIAGKSGFKAIQYLAVGIPFVMTPIGVCAEIGEHGVTHFNAETEAEWFDSLDALLTDPALRRKMGSRGREHFEMKYDLSDLVLRLEETLRGVAELS